MDNTVENKALECAVNGKDWQLGVEFEYTARATPQQNSLAEVGFKVIMNKARALMAHANLPLKIRYKLVEEAVKTQQHWMGLLS